MKRLKKSTVLPIAFFIYATAVFIYSIPRSTETTAYKITVVCISYAIIVALHFALKQKEKRMQKFSEMGRNDNKEYGGNKNSEQKE